MRINQDTRTDDDDDDTHLAKAQVHGGRFRDVHDFAIRSHHEDEAIQGLQQV